MPQSQRTEQGTQDFKLHLVLLLPSGGFGLLPLLDSLSCGPCLVSAAFMLVEGSVLGDLTDLDDDALGGAMGECVN